MPAFDRNRLLLPAAAGFSLLLAGSLCACGSDPVNPDTIATAATGQAATTNQQAASDQPDQPDEIDTEATIWTVLGLAKESSKKDPGPHTGASVSPVLWQAVHETLNFVRMASEDPMTGSLVTEWYSPKGKPNERYRIDVFILARALRSDSITVTVERQARTATGWGDTTVTKDVGDDLESAILVRAGEIHRARAAAAAS